MKLLIFLLVALYAKNTVEKIICCGLYSTLLGLMSVCWVCSTRLAMSVNSFFAFIPSSLHFTVDSEEEEG